MVVVVGWGGDPAPTPTPVGVRYTMKCPWVGMCRQQHADGAAYVGVQTARHLQAMSTA